MRDYATFSGEVKRSILCFALTTLRFALTTLRFALTTLERPFTARSTSSWFLSLLQLYFSLEVVFFGSLNVRLWKINDALYAVWKNMGGAGRGWVGSPKWTRLNRSKCGQIGITPPHCGQNDKQTRLTTLPFHTPLRAETIKSQQSVWKSQLSGLSEVITFKIQSMICRISQLIEAYILVMWLIES